MSYNHTMNQNP